MKLVVRAWICVSALGGALVLSVLLTAVNFERTARGGEAHQYGGDGLPQAAYNDPDGSRDGVETLIRTVQKLAGGGWPDGDRNNANAQPSLNERAVFVDIARRLLNDRSASAGESVEILIKLGKTLERSVKDISSLADNESTAREGEERSRDKASGASKDVGNDGRRSESRQYPEFNLDSGVVEKLARYVEENAASHHSLKRRRSRPMSRRIHTGLKLSNWQKWHNGINQRQVYDGGSRLVEGLLKDMSLNRIVGLLTIPEYGTQIKLVFKYADKNQALFKPMRWERDQERDPDIFYFDDFERHHAEIASFHLDRILEFYRVPPNVGRFVNITADIEPLASTSLKRTIFTSPAGSKCFYGKCDYYCDSGHPVCGRPDVIEGSLAAWLPFNKGLSKKSWENPWKRSYSKFRKAEWETNPNYCNKIRNTQPYKTGRPLLDLMDITIFDYLAGNQDRHHYHTFKLFGNQSSPVLYDNGRGFGWIYYDDASILAPVTQCCLIRFSTLAKLLKFETGPRRLSALMADSLSKDPLSSGPNGLILSEGHLRALDRRVQQILDAVWNCSQSRGINNVVADDGF